jgi:hypothetical protein
MVGLSGRALPLSRLELLRELVPTAGFVAVLINPSNSNAKSRMRSNEATPLSSQATASPSIMQERERRRASASTISGKRA